jgi:hypothetical protein
LLKLCHQTQAERHLSHRDQRQKEGKGRKHTDKKEKKIYFLHI